MEEGLRERKKRETRQRIADIAMGLFMARGFDNVTVAEVARAADVSVNTVFNYFSTKEDLFADRHDQAVDLPLRVLEEREPGESVVRAFRRDFFDAIGTRHWRYGFNLGADVFSRVVDASPALVARLRALHEDRKRSLAQALADTLDTGPDDVTPQLVSSHLLDTAQVLTHYSVRRRLAGEDWESIEPDLRAQAEQAFDLLEAGLGDLGAQGGGSPGATQEGDLGAREGAPGAQGEGDPGARGEGGLGTDGEGGLGVGGEGAADDGEGQADRQEAEGDH
ncbi:DNA-binding transcriptional regulator, AcrR family [Nonomuraea solani]|uniref:DNA-binding transcriptional regulator, AcrR family n=1 Tax=Nonomuraea solani TaxID=1144553 RepID=A0A1H6F0T0_9ACTN|nr:TetR/AcrR family transcriptional regulator [Nonomuraea solani]SEH03203.1 DNA-binding transcriptional regulator, AcrR family [Nonomuraea solani]